MKNAHAVTEDLEAALVKYTGAPYVCVVNSCTMALLLAVRWHRRGWVDIPKRTYISVPMSIIHAGSFPTFRDEDWVGAYQLKPLPIWDSARCFTGNMYKQGQMQCVSFHLTKILGDTQGGAILHDSKDADVWFRRARFDGRREGVAPKDDKFEIMGWHCYISPDVSTRLLQKLSVLPHHNDSLPNDDYPDLSLINWRAML